MPDTEPGPEDYRVPPHQLATWVVLGAAVVLIGGLVGVRLEHQPETTRDYPVRTLASLPHAEPVLLPSPEMNDEYLPCSDCHEDEPTNRTQRELEEEHEDKATLAHGDLWCLRCHDADNRDYLHLSDGTLVEFENSWQLCTQCHGKKLADWRAGVHGKRTGHWRGPSEYRTCVTCHNPHSPPFEPIEPKPVPVRPEHIGDGMDTASGAGDENHGKS
jgi:hypothetical protein